VKVSNNTYPSSENFPEISIGSVRNEIGGVFCGGADMTWIEYDTLTVNDFNVMHGVIPLAIVTGIFYPDLISDVMPEEYHLSQNYPNPFNPTTTIKFRLPKNEHVSLVIYNIMGRRIRTLIDEEKKADNYTVTWDGCDFYGTRVATGIYFYQLLANDAVITKKMLLMK
jgi:hypothetical protein